MQLKGKLLAKLIVNTAVLSVAAWIIGLTIFAASLPKLNSANQSTTAGGIIVLTGGKGRLQAGLQLLAEKRGARLLVSGVHPAVANNDLLHVTKAPQYLFDCCVDLDRTSIDTIDNAEQSAEWARTHGYKSVYLVTADYHMRRSLLLLQNALPNCEIIPYPVADNISLQAVAIEYTKFIVTFAGSALTA